VASAAQIDDALFRKARPEIYAVPNLFRKLPNV
jgi:hypothetical protein